MPRTMAARLSEPRGSSLKGTGTAQAARTSACGRTRPGALGSRLQAPSHRGTTSSSTQRAPEAVPAMLGRLGGHRQVPVRGALKLFPGDAAQARGRRPLPPQRARLPPPPHGAPRRGLRPRWAGCGPLASGCAPPWSSLTASSPSTRPTQSSSGPAARPSPARRTGTAAAREVRAATGPLRAGLPRASRPGRCRPRGRRV